MIVGTNPEQMIRFKGIPYGNLVYDEYQALLEEGMLEEDAEDGVCTMVLFERPDEMFKESAPAHLQENNDYVYHGRGMYDHLWESAMTVTRGELSCYVITVILTDAGDGVLYFIPTTFQLPHKMRKLLKKMD
ncbi:hypothetical protein N9112_00215 [bacterium]|nr:hypothetical protein [bacterium]